MSKVTIRHLIDFGAASQSLTGELGCVRKEISDMFDALEQYQRENSVELSNIYIQTVPMTEDHEDLQLVEYKITAESIKYENR